MADRRTERIALNESAFREINEQLETNVHRGLSDKDFAGFVCECGDGECEDTIRLPLPTYESIRSDAALFFVVPGHELPDVEDVIDGEDGRYLVVRKHDTARAIVEETDPRS